METGNRYLPSMQHTNRRLAPCTRLQERRLNKDERRLHKKFRSAMKQNRTYPPLREFIIDCIRYPDFSTPPTPLIANPRYALLTDTPFTNQTQIGWPNFYRGLISIQWKKIQYQYLLELNHGDIHAVDKWARMLTKNILEFSRIMWNERCTIAVAERDASYDGRKR